MNKKSGHIIRIVLGVYLAWLGVRLVVQAVQGKPSNMLFMEAMGVLFLIIGAVYAGFSVRCLLKIRKNERLPEERTSEEAGADAGVTEEIPVRDVMKAVESGQTDLRRSALGEKTESEENKPQDRPESEKEEAEKEEDKDANIDAKEDSVLRIAAENAEEEGPDTEQLEKDFEER